MATNQEILERAASTYSTIDQLSQLQEECAELIVAIAHFKRDRPHNLVEELADVQVLIDQVFIFWPGYKREFEDIKRRKLVRLERRMDGDNAT